MADQERGMPGGEELRGGTGPGADELHGGPRSGADELHGGPRQRAGKQHGGTSLDSDELEGRAEHETDGLMWVRERLLASPLAALATCALVMVTAFLAAALPRSVDRYEDTALRASVRSAPPQQSSVTLNDSADGASLADAMNAVDPLAPAQMTFVEQKFRQLIKPPLRVARETVMGARSASEVDVPDPGIPRLSAHLPNASLVAQFGLDKHTRLVAGRLPHASDAPGQMTIEGVVTQATAHTLHISVGQRVHLQKNSPKPITVIVTGIVAPRDPGSPYWNEDDDLLKPSVGSPPVPPGDEPKPYYHFTLLVDPTSAESILRLGIAADVYWYHPVDAGALSAHDVSALRKELASFDSGPQLVALQTATGSQVHIGGGFGNLLDDFAKERKAASPLVLIAAMGVGTTALAVLLMAGGLAAARRQGEIALLRSRGGSLLGVARRLAGETAAAAVPGGVIGTLLALVVLPTARWQESVLLGAIAAAVAWLALPLRAAWSVRRPRPGGREDVATARPSARRLIVELTVVVLVVGAVVALRHRSTVNGSDPFLAAAPALVAVAAALVLLRIYPVPLRVLARPAARLTGAVTHLGLARAGRSPATSQLPLLAMLVSLTVASFGGSVLAGISHGRDRAATATVGADARIDGQYLPLARQLPGQVRKVPGVGRVVAARVEPNSPDATFTETYDVVIVDPQAYAALTRGIGLPSFPAAVLAGPTTAHGVLPAVLSPKLAAELGHDTASISTGVGPVDIRAAATLPTTPATPGSEFVILSKAQVTAQHPGISQYGQYTDPTTLLLNAAPGEQIDGKALRKVTKHSTTFVTVLLRSEQRASMTDTPLQHGARMVYLSAVAAGALYSALAMLLSLLQAAPGRATLLARLRTMGMTRRQSRRLVLLEMMPQVLLAAVGGALVGLAVIPLLKPGVDLRALTFGTGAQALAPVDFGLGLQADPWSLALPSAGLLVLACAVLLVQVWVSGRRRESTELRVGDRV